MPDFEFNASFKMAAFNGGYLVTATVACECLDPECNGLKFITVWRNTEQECAALLVETIRTLEHVPSDKVRRETQLKS